MCPHRHLQVCALFGKFRIKRLEGIKEELLIFTVPHPVYDVVLHSAIAPRNLVYAARHCVPAPSSHVLPSQIPRDRASQSVNPTLIMV